MSRAHAADRLANRISDRMNAAVPWLWWPLDVPEPRRLLGLAETALYALHGVALALAARRIGVRLTAPLATTLGAASWLWFTGAWNRRAERLRAVGSGQSLR